MLVRDCTGC